MLECSSYNNILKSANKMCVSVTCIDCKLKSDEAKYSRVHPGRWGGATRVAPPKCVAPPHRPGCTLELLDEAGMKVILVQNN